MQRRKFLATTAVTFPSIAFGQIFSAHDSRTTKGFVVKANESRFNRFGAMWGRRSQFYTFVFIKSFCYGLVRRSIIPSQRQALKRWLP